MCGLDPCALLLGRLRQRLAGDVRRDPAEHLEQAGRPCVDDAGVAEDVQLLLRAQDGRVSALDQAPHESGQIVVVRRLRGLREHANRREHGALDGIAHLRVGEVARRSERRGDRGPVDLPSVAQNVGRAADHHREDDAGVPPAPEQGGASDEARQRGPVGIAVRLRVERLDDRADGERQVGARVAVGNRVDVQVVDPVAVSLQRVQGCARERKRDIVVAHVEILTSRKG